MSIKTKIDLDADKLGKVCEILQSKGRNKESTLVYLCADAIREYKRLELIENNQPDYLSTRGILSPYLPETEQPVELSEGTWVDKAELILAHEAKIEMGHLANPRHCLREILRVCGMKRESGWQPIETAPKEGKIVLYSGKKNLEGDRISVGIWGEYCISNYPRFTHWMPLPPLPLTTKLDIEGQS